MTWTSILESDLKNVASEERKLPSISAEDKSLIISVWTRDHPTSSDEFKEILFTEYLKFMAIQCELNQEEAEKQFGIIFDQMYCPSTIIDSMWHSHIICTRAYEKFCKANGFGELIHHTPAPSETSSSEAYIRTIARYEELFLVDPVTKFPQCWEVVLRGSTSSSSKSSTAQQENDVADASNVDGTDVVVKRGRGRPAGKRKHGHDLDDSLEKEKSCSTKKGKTSEGSAAGAVDAAATAVSAAAATTVVALPDRHTTCLDILVKAGIASRAMPFSKQNKSSGKWEFTGFLRNCSFGPGSNMNAIYFCNDCSLLWEYKKRNDSEQCVHCNSKDVRSCITCFGCC